MIKNNEMKLMPVIRGNDQNAQPNVQSSQLPSFPSNQRDSSFQKLAFENNNNNNLLSKQKVAGSQNNLQSQMVRPNSSYSSNKQNLTQLRNLNQTQQFNFKQNSVHNPSTPVQFNQNSPMQQVNPVKELPNLQKNLELPRTGINKNGQASLLAPPLGNQTMMHATSTTNNGPNLNNIPNQNIFNQNNNTSTMNNNNNNPHHQGFSNSNSQFINNIQQSSNKLNLLKNTTQVNNNNNNYNNGFQNAPLNNSFNNNSNNTSFQSSNNYQYDEGEAIYPNSRQINNKAPIGFAKKRPESRNTLHDNSFQGQYLAPPITSAFNNPLSIGHNQVPRLSQPQNLMNPDQIVGRTAILPEKIQLGLENLIQVDNNNDDSFEMQFQNKYHEPKRLPNSPRRPESAVERKNQEKAKLNLFERLDTVNDNFNIKEVSQSQSRMEDSFIQNDSNFSQDNREKSKFSLQPLLITIPQQERTIVNLGSENIRNGFCQDMDISKPVKLFTQNLPIINSENQTNQENQIKHPTDQEQDNSNALPCLDSPPRITRKNQEGRSQFDPSNSMSPQKLLHLKKLRKSIGSQFNILQTPKLDRVPLFRQFQEKNKEKKEQKIINKFFNGSNHDNNQDVLEVISNQKNDQALEYCDDEIKKEAFLRRKNYHRKSVGNFINFEIQDSQAQSTNQNCLTPAIGDSMQEQRPFSSQFRNSRFQIPAFLPADFKLTQEFTNRVNGTQLEKVTFKRSKIFRRTSNAGVTSNMNFQNMSSDKFQI